MTYCPDCGTKLKPRSKDPSGWQVKKVCSRCQLLWTLNVGDGMGGGRDEITSTPLPKEKAK